MQYERRIGYARIDGEADTTALDDWVHLLKEIAVHEVFTDIGPLPERLEGLQDAVRRLRINDVLIYPEACLRELTIEDIPLLFGYLPEHTGLQFFQPSNAKKFECRKDLTSIRLVNVYDEEPNR